MSVNMETCIPKVSQGLGILIGQQEPKSSTSRTEGIAINSLMNRVLEASKSFQAISGKEFDLIEEELSHVDEWMISFLTNIVDGPLSSVEEHFDYLSHLSLENQIALLTEAKNLAEKMVNTTSTNDAKGDNAASIFTLIDEKLQKCQRDKPNFSASLPIDTKQERELEAILNEERSKARQAATRETNYKKLGEFVSFTGSVATIFTACYLAEQLLGKQLLVLGTIALVTASIYNRTIVINSDGTSPSVLQKLRCAFEGHFTLGIQDVGNFFQG